MSSHVDNNKEFSEHALELRSKALWALEKWPGSKLGAQWRHWALLTAERSGTTINWGEELWCYAQGESLTKNNGQKKPEVYALREMQRAAAEKKIDVASASESKQAFVAASQSSDPTTSTQALKRFVLSGADTGRCERSGILSRRIIKIENIEIE